MGKPVRLRVVFEDAGLLRGSHRRRGLQRFLIQLLPGIETIADLAAHLHASFGLQSSCPNGLIISMDDFILPSFESTSILKDEDLIMIKKNGVMFRDIVKFCGSQNQEQALQCKQISTFNNRNLAIMDTKVGSQGDENDTVHFNRNAVHIETLSSEKMNDQCKRKRSNKLQGFINTLAIKDSQGDLRRDEENAGLHGNIARKETASNEMVNAKRKKKHSKELQTSEYTFTSANKDSKADLQGDKGDSGLPIPQKETLSSEMIKLKRKRKHFDKLQGPDDTLAIKDSQRNSKREEEDGLYRNTAQKKATSNDMMNAITPSTANKFRGDSQEDEGDFWLPIGTATHKETSCEMKNAKRKEKHSKKPRISDDTLAIEDSQADSQGSKLNVDLHGNTTHLGTTSNEMMNTKHMKNHINKHLTSVNTLAVMDCQRDSPGDVKGVGLPDGNIACTETPSEITNAIKRKHSNMLQASDRKESKGNDDGHVSKNDANEDVKKVVSRSARRKKAKKLYYRTLNKEKLIEVKTPEGDDQKETPEYATSDQNTYVDKEIVPVIVRPGYIRFESPDACTVRAAEPVETLQWNGTTSKKKGQKWGRENTSNKCNDDTSKWLCNGESSNAKKAELVEVYNEKSAVEEVEAYEESIVNQVELAKECNGNSVSKDNEAVKQLIVFESCLPLIRPPEEEDVLVYRLVELSSSWCPELSSFRVGRVSSFDSNSSKIILLPLPEYPLVSEEISEEGQESRSLYKEDGTLEIDFASLVDVRLFKVHESIETTPSTTTEEMQKAATVNNQETASCSSNRIEISSNHTVNDQLGEGWEAINQALNEKKSQLQKRIAFDERNSSLRTTTTGPWSYRALRRNALGPTLAMLRNNNGDSGK